MERILFCNITYMKHYDRINYPNDDPRNGGEYVKRTNDAFEKYNFHICEDGYVRGFVETKYKGGYKEGLENNLFKKIHIENIDPSFKKKDKITNVLVVFCALKKQGSTVIVGYYKDATVLRGREYYKGRVYNIIAKKEDVVLFNENERTFNVPRAKANPEKFGFGMANVWYCRERKAESFKQSVFDYVNNLDLSFGEELEDTDNVRYKESGEAIIISVEQRRRNVQARLECLKIYGHTCQICGFDASKVYGLEYKNKIEVHHINPIHTMEGDYYIDPKTELIPVCPNCHMILHTKVDGKYITIEELKLKFKHNKGE